MFWYTFRQIDACVRTCVCVCVSVCVCECVCVCVCECVWERAYVWEPPSVCVCMLVCKCERDILCVCMCLCVRVRERERELVCVCVWVCMCVPYFIVLESVAKLKKCSSPISLTIFTASSCQIGCKCITKICYCTTTNVHDLMKPNSAKLLRKYFWYNWPCRECNQRRRKRQVPHSQTISR